MTVVSRESDPVGRAAIAARPTGRSLSLTVRRRIAIWVMITPALLGLLIFFAYPLVANVYYSLTRYDMLTPPRWIGLRNYQYLFTKDPAIGTAVRNTLWLVAILVPVRVVSAMAVAGFLTRVKHAAGFWRTLFYLPALVPPVASTVAFVFLFNPGVGPVNQILKLIGIRGPLWFSDPNWSKPSLVLLGMWVLGDIMIIFLASLLDVPTEQYEAASIDGANGMQKVRYVTLPHITPVIVFAIITGVIAALQYFTEAAIASSVASGTAGVNNGIGAVLGYPANSLLTYTQWLYVRGFSNFQLGYAAALAVVLFVVAGAFVALLLRQFNAFSPEGRS
jgi:multiple sugar transport system permease protein